MFGTFLVGYTDTDTGIAISSDNRVKWSISTGQFDTKCSNKSEIKAITLDFLNFWHTDACVSQVVAKGIFESILSIDPTLIVQAYIVQ